MSQTGTDLLFVTDVEELDKLRSSLPSPAECSNIKIQPIEFEKDDDDNFHMDFITSCSNLRAENYDIAPADKYKVRNSLLALSWLS